MANLQAFYEQVKYLIREQVYVQPPKPTRPVEYNTCAR